MLHSVTLLLTHSVVSDSLWPHGLQHARHPSPSSTSGACSNSCPLTQWCHTTISSSVVPFSTSSNLSQYQSLFQWVGSLHEVAKVLELQHQSFQWIFRFLLGLTGLISLLSKGLLRVTIKCFFLVYIYRCVQFSCYFFASQLPAFLYE